MQTTQPKQRIHSIDILRGLVMLIMALDHVRDFFHITAMTDDPLNLQTTTPSLFFTRWITHFCAPIFVFLSGTSAYLSGQRRSKKELSLFLIKRGLWLVLAEMLIVTLGLSFNPFYNAIFLQVIWAIGWSMVILGIVVHLPIAVIITIGCILVIGHNLTDLMQLPTDGAAAILTNVFVTARGYFIPLSNSHGILVLYAILPWTGIMLLGYGLGTVFQPEISRERRHQILVGLGLGAILLFAVLRYTNVYGDPNVWAKQPTGLYTFLSFINTTKYPPSLLYTSMTIGPALLLLVLLERVSNRLTSIFSVYGRVPFFYYILHFYLIHSLMVILFFASGYSSSQIADGRSPFLFRPADFGYQMIIVYSIWLALISLLYFPCRWYDQYKRTHRQWWLSYL